MLESVSFAETASRKLLLNSEWVRGGTDTQKLFDRDSPTVAHPSRALAERGHTFIPKSTSLYFLGLWERFSFFAFCVYFLFVFFSPLYFYFYFYFYFLFCCFCFFFLFCFLKEGNIFPDECLSTFCKM